MDYKKTDYYSIKEWVYPNIEKILDTSFNLSENIILYLPRNIEIEELITLIFQSYERIRLKNGKDFDTTLFCDIHILNSANKTKALLVLVGEMFNSVNKYFIL
jgi:hypothetical protein